MECVARAVNSQGHPGLELSSNAVTVSSNDGICLPQATGFLGAEPFSAKIKYTGPSDPDHPNMVRVSVLVPHRDGMLPAISTHILSNFDLALSPDAFRVGLHKCSNLIDVDEKETHESFSTPDLRNRNSATEVLPFQFNKQLRSEPTLKFYRSLDLESCVWQFVTYYSLSELVNQCGGQIGTDGQVLNLTQSYVSIRVPLYVSYVFHSPIARAGWQSYNLQTQLQLTFVYDTAILWQDGISTPEGSELKGFLHPTSMRLLQDGRLQVQLRTEALFRGQFVPNHSGASFKSTVTFKNHPALTFTLEHLKSEPTFAQPEQMWQFTSDYAVRDYSGNYIVKLVPCTTPMDQPFTRPISCNPHEPVPFDLQIRFQQISDPVATEFSLNIQFHLLQKKSLWLSDGSMGFGEGIDASFTTG
ncbi:FRAS1-related extracellular matrix protein 2 [Lamellibrachia satsuma]|nr:FRAS1-related extracellular matrix protein 2 [Lamellibrachia satsuma]